MLRPIIFTAVFFLVACGNQDVAPGASAAGNSSSEASSASAAPKSYFISAANPYAVEAGEAILKRGGSALDAAIATQAVLGLVEPQSSGLGGGGFLLHFDPATGVLRSYDGRETAPASATADRFLKEDGTAMPFYDAVAGGLSVGVPGMVRLLELVHGEHGKLPWSDLFVPAEDLADAGFNVSPRLNGLLGRIPRLKQLPAAAAYFYDEDGAPHPVGHLLKNPAYAETLRAIASDGADVFYTGAIAEAIVTAVNEAPNPGGMTLTDLASYRPIERTPVCGPYRSFEICSMAPPSSGGVTLLQILSLLEPFDLSASGADSVASLHLLFEASRLAYADRNRFLADQDQAAADGGPTQEELVAGLLNPPYLAARSALIATDKAAESVTAGDPTLFPIADGTMPGAWRGLADDASPEPPSTTHFVIVDGEGRVVSMTSTVEFAFGSHLMAAGMILNNQLTDFSFLPERDGVPVANAVAPGKRPRSSMSPVIVFDNAGNLAGAIGSPGGPAIIGYVAKTLIGVIDWGLKMQDAVDGPHAVYPRGAPIVEADKFSEETIEALKQLGHEPNARPLASGLHGFMLLEDGSFDGAADPRREGVWRSGTIEE